MRMYQEDKGEDEDEEVRGGRERKTKRRMRTTTTTKMITVTNQATFTILSVKTWKKKRAGKTASWRNKTKRGKAKLIFPRFLNQFFFSLN